MNSIQLPCILDINFSPLFEGYLRHILEIHIDMTHKNALKVTS